MLRSCTSDIFKRSGVSNLPGLHKSYPYRRNPLATYSGALVQVSEEVREAVDGGRPVVALESTIYTHGRSLLVVSRFFQLTLAGFPYPKNLELASRLESLARSKGVIPATIGIIQGIPKVGLDKSDFDDLLDPSRRNGLQPMKASSRDIAHIHGLVSYHDLRYLHTTALIIARVVSARM